MAVRSTKRYRWQHVRRAKLLETRICDLGLTMEGTWLEPLVDRIHHELSERGLRLRPHVWLSDEWSSPDGVPGFAVPFYLAHPRLARLERSMMLELEGGTRREALMVMRHEVGHAVQHAWNLQRRRRFQKMFGPTTRRYPDSYRPNPTSKRFVQHLDGFYAQAHPVEDFAETFAVWLRPRSNWRRRYQEWPALKKLEYVDELMSELAGTKPAVRIRERPYSLRTLKNTLGEHYERKKRHYSPTYRGTYDRDLTRLFDGEEGEGERAAAFLRRHRRDIRSVVSKWTGEYEFTVDQVMRQMIGRCDERKLRTNPARPPTVADVAIILTVHAMTYLYKVRFWHPV